MDICRPPVQSADPKSSRRSEFVPVQLGLFDVHVLEFAGVEDLATFETFDEFTFLIAGDDSNARMLTFSHGHSLSGKLGDGGINGHKAGYHSAGAAE